MSRKSVDFPTTTVWPRDRRIPLVDVQIELPQYRARDGEKKTVGDGDIMDVIQNHAVSLVEPGVELAMRDASPDHQEKRQPPTHRQRGN